VVLRFNERFHMEFVRGMKFNVRFSIKRTGFVFMHEALDVANRGLVAGARPELLLPPPYSTAVLGNGVQVQTQCLATGPVHVPGALLCLFCGQEHGMPTSGLAIYLQGAQLDDFIFIIISTIRP
jgi:hypothetical protein